MSNICIIANGKKEKISQSAESLKDWLVGEGHNVRLKILADISAAANAGDTADIRAENKSLGASGVKTDLAISMGGDGAILHTVEAFSDLGVPVLGVNYGQLGYLAEVRPEEVQQAVKSFFENEYEIQERMRLTASSKKSPNSKNTDKHMGNALNEIVLAKIQSGHTVRLAVSIGEEPFLTYEADGLIISTPTGSTAYSLSAGGPIVEPELETIIITPVAPHMIFDRSLVIASESELNVEVQGRYSVEFSMDGFSYGELKPGESICITRASQSARLITYTQRNFHRTLKSKFGVKDR